MTLVLEPLLTHAAWAWAAAGAALLAAEILSGSGWLLWPAAAAGVTALLSGFAPLALAVQVLLFATLTIVSTLAARRWLPRRSAGRAQDINDNIGRLMGREARVVSTFAAGEGRVFVDGKEWAAELAAGQTLEAGARAVVIGVSGSRLKVRAADQKIS